MPKKSKKKYYLIKQKNRRYGCFPLTPKGYSDAEQYVKNLPKASGEKFEIVPA
jgi:hypothetical protein